MRHDELTAAEQEFIQSLPKPPTIGSIRTTNIWIIEWLSPAEFPTGRKLHEWIGERRGGWSTLVACRSKVEVLEAIEDLARAVERTGILPVLHIEAHGSYEGLCGPNDTGGVERLSWDDLTQPLQLLNKATRCNLAIVVAACTGFAAIKAFTRGPRAPAAILVGPTVDVTGGNLLEGMKELYRRWHDQSPTIDEIVASANQQSPTVSFEIEPFVTLAYEATVHNLVLSLRPDVYEARKERIHKRLRALETWSEQEIESRLASLPKLPPSNELQRIWDELFMIDLYPENKERFGLDMISIARMATAELQ